MSSGKVIGLTVGFWLVAISFLHATPNIGSLASRELSGGMRQRVEIARALAPNPKIISMDEPFGALDFVTRLKKRADLTGIWQEEKKTIVFVTHDIEESVKLADRVVVLSSRPGTIRKQIRIDLPRPCDLDSSGYLSVRDEIFHAIGMSLKVGAG